jgi:hypothetical protein
MEAAMSVRRKVSSRATTNAYGIPVPERLLEAIEAERDSLFQADSLLACLILAMEHAGEDTDVPYYPDVLRHIRGLMKGTVRGLDSLALRGRVLGDQVEERGSLLPAVVVISPADMSSASHRTSNEQAVSARNRRRRLLPADTEALKIFLERRFNLTK